MTQNEIIVSVPATEQLPAELQEAWDSITKVGDFIPRIQLYGSNSNAVKKEIINQGRYGFPKSGDEIVDLGKEVNCIPLHWLFKAMRFGNEGDPPEVSYNPKEPLFESIKEEASEGGLTGCVYGIEFLLFLPDPPPDVVNYVTLFLNSPSSRREAGNFRGQLGKAATLKVRLASNKKGTWHVPTITSCSTPFENLPEEEEMKAKVEQFQNPPEQKQEKADSSKVDAQDVDR